MAGGASHPHPPFSCSMQYTLNCLVLGGVTPFEVEIDGSRTVHQLKREIKNRKENDLNGIDAVRLTLYKVDIDISDEDKLKSMKHDVSKPGYVFNPKIELGETFKVSRYFEQISEENPHLHILVELPRGKSIDPRAWVPSLRICSSPHEFTQPYCLRLHHFYACCNQ